MDGLVILSRQEQEYLLHAIESSLDVAELRQLFLWSQGQLQALLPHRMLICLRLEPDGDIACCELLHSGVLPAALTGALCDAEQGLARAVLQRWRAQGGVPLALHADEEGEVRGTARGTARGEACAEVRGEERRLARLGIANVLAHGSGPLPGGATFFIACGLPQRPGARHAHFLRLLLPHLHIAWQRIGTGQGTRLSPREAQVLRWLREGKSNDEIGRILGISPLTVKNHLQRLYRTLGVGNRAHAVARGTALHWPVAE